jgi:hypothetical protein
MINVREHRSFLKQVEQAINLGCMILTFSHSLRCRALDSLYIMASNYPSSSQIIPVLPTASRYVEWIACPPALLAAWVRISCEWDGFSRDLPIALWHRILLCLVTRLHIPIFSEIHTFTLRAPNISWAAWGHVRRPVFPFAPERLFLIVRSKHEEHSSTLVLWEARTMCKIPQWTFVSNHRSPTNREWVGR